MDATNGLGEPGVHTIAAANGDRSYTKTSKVLAWSSAIVAIIIFLSLSFVVYGHVFSDGMCCADDSTNAIIAKNLAFGYGYTNSLSFTGVPGLRPFDPNITTGPTLNLPAAAMIYIFGNVPWAPGFVTATASLILLIAIFIFLLKPLDISSDAAYIALLIVLLYNMTADLHFEHWYSLIGELPAALMCVCGAAILASAPDNRWAVVTASLLYGLAFTTKLVALLGAVPFVIWLLAAAIVIKTNRRRRMFDYMLAALAFIAPFAAFETWKLLVLGPKLYMAANKEFLFIFASNAGTVGSGSAAIGVGSALQRYAANSAAITQHFGYSPLMLLLVAIVVAALFYSYSPNRNIRILFTMLMGGALVHGIWWLYSSTGLPRYALIGLFMYFGAIACVVFVRQSFVVVASITALLLCSFWSGYPRLAEPIKFVLQTRYHYTPRVANLLKTAEFLSKESEDRPFETAWWATAGDMEYAMPTVGNFVQAGLPDTLHHGPTELLARNTIWVRWATTPQFTAEEKRCTKVIFDAAPYLVSSCPEPGK